MIDVYLTETATLVKSGGYDRFGEPLAGTTEEIAVKYAPMQRLITDARGEQVAAAGSFMLKARDLTLEDEFEFQGRRYVILNIRQLKNFGWYYLEAFVQ